MCEGEGGVDLLTHRRQYMATPSAKECCKTPRKTTATTAYYTIPVMERTDKLGEIYHILIGVLIGAQRDRDVSRL